MRRILDLPTIAALVAVLVAVIAGLLMWLPSDKQPSRPSDLGAAIIGGAVVALSVLAIEASRGRRAALEAEERHREQREWDETNRQRVRDDQLRLTLNLQTRLIGVRLDGRDLTEVYIPSRILVKARMVETKLEGAVLYRSDLQHADMRRAILRNADLGRCILNNARLQGADLSGCDLGAADLRRVDLSQTIGLDTAKLANAVFDYATKWPEGVDPIAHHALEVEYDDHDPEVVWPMRTSTTSKREQGGGRLGAGNKLDVGPVGYERSTPVRSKASES
jgi:hypothetical protein